MNKKFLIGATMISSAVAFISIAVANKLSKVNDELIDAINDMIVDDEVKLDDDMPDISGNLYVPGDGCSILKFLIPAVYSNFKVDINKKVNHIRFIDPESDKVILRFTDIVDVDIQDDHITFTTPADYKFTVDKIKAVSLEEAHKIYDENHNKED